MSMPGGSGRALLASPVAFLAAITFINWFGYASWQALFNNFARDAAQFTGWEVGVLQSVREIPGFLSFTAVVWFLFMREQTFAYLSAILLGAGVALTGFFPSYSGLLATTFLMSVGFHYFETANQALALQVLPKKDTPRILGNLASAAAAAQLLAYSLVALVWWTAGPSYTSVYLGLGVATLVLTALAAAAFARFDGDVPQRKGIVLRRRYWLFYTLTFLSGARRQLFMAFGGWLLVERFGYEVGSLAGLLFAYCAINLVVAPLFGRMIGRIGERNSIVIENVALIVVFIGYATTSNALVAGFLFMLDGVFFTLMLAQRTYFQKIADPADIAPTASVSFTINHIAAVFIPVLFGRLWISDYTLVFAIGAAIATLSLALAFLVPRHPEPGRETILRAPEPVPAE